MNVSELRPNYFTMDFFFQTKKIETFFLEENIRVQSKKRNKKRL